LGDTWRIGQITLTLSVTASNPTWSDGPTVPKVNTQAATNYGETVQEVSEPERPVRHEEAEQRPIVEPAKPVTPVGEWPPPKMVVVKHKTSFDNWGPIVAIAVLIVLSIGGGGVNYVQNQRATATRVAKATATAQAMATDEVRATATAKVRGTETAKILATADANMIKIPAGKFTMGSNKGSDNEKPVHLVDLAQYNIDKYETTNAQYTACVQTGKCTPSRCDEYENGEKANHPVVCVNWNQAKAYCEWRGGRLPTETEWEKAARGTDERIYPWGNESPNDTLLNYEKKVGDTTEVGSYPKGASPYGVMDMAGNVWEWVSSDYKPYPYKADDGREDLLDNTEKGLRGGSWPDNDISSRTTHRNNIEPTASSGGIGFRCVR